MQPASEGLSVLRKVAPMTDLKALSARWRKMQDLFVEAHALTSGQKAFDSKAVAAAYEQCATELDACVDALPSIPDTRAWAQHKADCGALIGDYDNCTCGLDAALAAGGEQ